jgi:hypothetical protein
MSVHRDDPSARRPFPDAQMHRAVLAGAWLAASALATCQHWLISAGVKPRSARSCDRQLPRVRLTAAIVAAMLSSSFGSVAC